MSLLTPENVSVKYYKSTDVGAPALNKTPNCMATIFKACLVTGYGTKEGAGWTMPFEDTGAGVKVFRPTINPDADFFLRLSADTGTQVVSQVYLNMVDANTGDLKLQCDTPFKYAKGVISGRWLLIASPRGVWFFSEQTKEAKYTPLSQSGAFFYTGSLSSNDAEPAVYLQHTGGNDSAGAYSTITIKNKFYTSPGNVFDYIPGKLLRADQRVETVNATCITGWNGVDVAINQNMLAQFLVVASDNVFVLPALLVASDGVTHSNFNEVIIANEGSNYNTVVFGTGGAAPSNFYILIDRWIY